MTLGEQIRSAREAKTLSQEALAEYLGVSRQAVSKWENGTAVPQGANMAALIEILELDAKKEEPAPKTRGVIFWLGWVVAGILLLTLVGTLIHWNPFALDTPDSFPLEVPNSVHDPIDVVIKEPALHSIRFYDETQQEVLCPWSANEFPAAYNMALVDSILLQWIGPDAVLETVKVFRTPTGGKTELVQEFKVSHNSSYAVLLPADTLRRNGPAHMYFELHFAGNYTIKTENIQIYFDDNITFDAYIEGFDSQRLTYDKVEWIGFTSEEELARAEELGLEDPGSGFVIYNEQDAAAQSLVAENCTYTVLDWNSNFVPVTVSASEFQTILDERTWPGTPYVLTFRNNKIISVQERYIP